MEYKITLTETEKLALEYVAYDAFDWIEHAAKERARIAIEDIVKLAIEKFLELGINIPNSKEEIVISAYNYGWIQKAKDKTPTLENKL